MNDEGSGAFLPERPVDVHSHSYRFDVNKGELLG